MLPKPLQQREASKPTLASLVRRRRRRCQWRSSRPWRWRTRGLLNSWAVSPARWKLRGEDKLVFSLSSGRAGAKQGGQSGRVAGSLHWEGCQFEPSWFLTKGHPINYCWNQSITVLLHFSLSNYSLCRFWNRRISWTWCMLKLWIRLKIQRYLIHNFFCWWISYKTIWSLCSRREMKQLDRRFKIRPATGFTFSLSCWFSLSGKIIS